MKAPASSVIDSPAAAAAKRIDFAPSVHGQGRFPPKRINVACLCSSTGRATAEGVDFTAGLRPDSREKHPQLLEEARQPAAVPAGCRGRALRGRGYRRHQCQTQTQQNHQATKRPHTVSFSGEQPGRASTGCAVALQEVWCLGEVGKSLGREKQHHSPGEVL